MISKLLKWQDDRGQLALLRSHLDELDRDFADEKLRFASDKYLRAYSTYQNDYELTAAEIDRIETKKIIARANYWAVPIPALPSSALPTERYWHWCRVHHKYYLTTEGQAFLRRRTYDEIKTRFKPCIVWLAISFICLFAFLRQS